MFDTITGYFTNIYCPISRKKIKGQNQTSSGHWLVDKEWDHSISARCLSEHWDEFCKNNKSGAFGKAGCYGEFDMSLGIVYEYELWKDGKEIFQEVVIYDPKKKYKDLYPVKKTIKEILIG